MTPQLVLGSTSRYRRELLGRFGLPFRAVAPEVDESPLAGETAPALVARLAEAKARAVAVGCPGALVVGSDQAASLDDAVLGKPGTVDAARAQLRACSARVVEFHTAICVVDTRDGSVTRAQDCTRVAFRPLDEATIARYVDAEQPLDCAGSFKCEGLGIALFERIEGIDPTALVGLPLIALARLLRERGLQLP